MVDRRFPWPDARLPLWLFAVYIVYPIPHTVALRNLLLAIGLGYLIWSTRPWRANAFAMAADLRWARPAGVLVMVLTIWMSLQSAFLSPFPERALPLLGGQWPLILLVASIGLVMAYRQPHATLQALALALSTHILILLLYQAYDNGFGATPFADRDYHSLLNGSLLALLLGDRQVALSGKTAPLGLPGKLVWALLFLSLVADVCLRTRNGTVVTVALVALAVAWLAMTGQRRLRLWLIGASLAMAVLVGISLVKDKRWQGFTEAIAIGATSESLHWLSPEVMPPPTSSGRALEESAYDRAAWAKQAVEAIIRYPLGLGFGHQAFGWAVELKYGVKGMESSHSGWLDFTLANGLPGLALWLSLSGWLIVAGWRNFRAGDGRGLLLAFSVFAYLLRCLLDGHLSGWRLAMYAMLIGAIVGAMSRRPESE